MGSPFVHSFARSKTAKGKGSRKKDSVYRVTTTGFDGVRILRGASYVAHAALVVAVVASIARETGIRLSQPMPDQLALVQKAAEKGYVYRYLPKKVQNFIAK
jgi:hypothetical protein